MVFLVGVLFFASPPLHKPSSVSFLPRCSLFLFLPFPISPSLARSRASLRRTLNPLSKTITMIFIKKTDNSYIEKYVAADADPAALREHPATALAPLVHVALALSDVAKLTGRKEPTVIT